MKIPSIEFKNNFQPEECEEFNCQPVDMENNIAIGKAIDFRFLNYSIIILNFIVLCSSGTTGLPKGVQLTQINVIILLSLFK